VVVVVVVTTPISDNWCLGHAQYGHGQGPLQLETQFCAPIIAWSPPADTTNVHVTCGACISVCACMFVYVCMYVGVRKSVFMCAVCEYEWHEGPTTTAPCIYLQHVVAVGYVFHVRSIRTFLPFSNGGRSSSTHGSRIKSLTANTQLCTSSTQKARQRERKRQNKRDRQKTEGKRLAAST
jgi:hypothetical protein